MESDSSFGVFGLHEFTNSSMEELPRTMSEILVDSLWMSESLTQHRPSDGSGSAAASSSFCEAEPDETFVKLHRSSSNKVLPPFMPEPRPVHPAAIWERIKKFVSSFGL